jgi:catechol 2,3-dioxygenase-like lactoylglutathione lyase family enzyme
MVLKGRRMFSHVVLGSNDLERSKTFYDAIFPVMGVKPGRREEETISYVHDGALLVVRTPRDGREATHGNGSTIGFTIGSPEQVDAWHEAGCQNGGKSCEDPPGIRQGAHGPLYLAYLRDPDGNKLCAVHRMPAEDK